MRRGAVTNKADMTHIIDTQTVQAVSIAVVNINRMKRVLQRGKLATSVSIQTTSKKIM